MTKDKQTRKTEVVQAPGLAETNKVNTISTEVTHARLMTGGAFASSVVVDAYFPTTSTDLNTILETLQERAKAIHQGDMKQVESMLLGQAVALQSMFADFASRAKKAQSSQAVQTLTQLALRSQAGCRSTLQTLADVKYPRQVAFVKQTNVAQTQQVNNGSAPSPRARKIEDEPIELLVETSHGRTKMDTRAKAAAGRTDKDLVSVEESHGSNKRGRKAKIIS